MAKKGSKGAKGPTPHLRSRTTRSSRGRLVTSTDSNPNEQLTTQLSLLGLYAAPTIGDGNCLFRALSDQVYGSAVKHSEVRQQVCDWIAAHGERYEGFVEDDGDGSDSGRGKRRGKGGKDKASNDHEEQAVPAAGPSKRLQSYLRGMRENATYGGHMELSAFAHMTRRNIKVIQPGLVYVIEWRAGGESSSTSSSQPLSSATRSEPQPMAQDNDLSGSPRRSKRTPSVTSPHKKHPEEGKEKHRLGHGYYVYEEVTSDEDNNADAADTGHSDVKEEEQEGAVPEESAEEDGGPTIYVAYHDWEHFSSIRNLAGPHSGLPNIRETPAYTEPLPPQEDNGKKALKEREREKKRERERKEKEKKSRSALKVKLKLPKGTSAPTSDAASPAPVSQPPPRVSDPVTIPLPTSRAVSPLPPQARSLPACAHAELRYTPTPDRELPPVSASSMSSAEMASGHLRSHSRQAHLLTGTPAARAQYRSPKRTFDESSASGCEDADGREGREKRSRTRLPGEGISSEVEAVESQDMNVDGDPGADTPALSGSGSGSSSSELSFSEAGEDGSSSSSTSPSPAPELKPASAPTPSMTAAKKWGGSGAQRHQHLVQGEKALTRRQRKALGLPKQRSIAPPVGGHVSAGKIVIPGGRWTGRVVPPSSSSTAPPSKPGEGTDEEWRRNGTGRLDVRGFRELKI